MKSIKELEKEYMSKQHKFLIEDAILYSFSKKDLKNLITSTEESYLQEALPYKHQIAKELCENAITDEFEKYFVEQIHFFFWGWQKIQLTKEFLQRLKNFYKLNHTDFFNKKEWEKININSIPITQIIGMYTKLPSNLKNNICCPLHKDKTPSFKIYEDTNSFYCFGCHKWGNAINFVAEKEWWSTKEAFKKIVNLYSK